MKPKKPLKKAFFDKAFKRAMARPPVGTAKLTKAQLAYENTMLKLDNVELMRKAEMIGRWILEERTKLIVGSTDEDRQNDHRSPLPCNLWRCAQELMGDRPARVLMHELDNAKRSKLGLPLKDWEHHDFWLRNG